MRLLLDTNALIWLIEQPTGRQSLGLSAQNYINNASVVFVSSISIVEIRIKTMVGKLGTRADLLEDIAKAGCESLAFSDRSADMLQKFPQLARHDPFDRMLLAQAHSEKLTFLTADTALLELNLDYVMNARS